MNVPERIRMNFAFRVGLMKVFVSADTRLGINKTIRMKAMDIVFFMIASKMPCNHGFTFAA